MRYFLPLSLFAMVLIGCGTASFNFRVYGLNAKSYEGTLLGKDKTGKDDLPLSVCQPDDKVKGKCIVILASEFFKMKADYLRIQTELSDLQRKCPK